MYNKPRLSFAKTLTKKIAIRNAAGLRSFFRTVFCQTYRVVVAALEIFIPWTSREVRQILSQWSGQIQIY